jgi:hypothetical protein
MVSFPLPHYEGDAGATSEAAAKSLAQQRAYESLKSDVSARVAAAASKSSGTLPAQVTASSKQVEDKAHDLGAAAAVAGGALNSFARAIRTYNTQVDGLNREYEAAKQANFDVASDAGAEEGMSPAEKARAHANAVDAADAALKQQLEARRKGYEQTLEAAGDHAAGLLNRGAYDAAVLELVMSGDLPASSAAPYVAMSVGTLNDLRGNIGTIKGLHGLPGSLAALSKYILKLNGSEIRGLVKLHKAAEIAKYIEAHPVGRFDIAGRIFRRLDAWDAAKLSALEKAEELRGLRMIDDAMPGPLLGKFGENTRFLGTASKWAGRAMAPLGAVAGAYGFGDTIANWGDLSTEDRVTGLVGNGAGFVAGAGGTALMLGAAIPPVGAAVIVGAGVVALGTLAYQNREAIANFAEGAWNAGEDFVADPVGTVSEGLETVEEGLSDAGEAVGDFFGF